HYGRADGLTVGTVVQILPAGAGAWIGGGNGLMHFDGTRFTPVAGRNGEPFAGITGMVFARDGIPGVAQRRRHAVVHDDRRRVR
ncbi:hypothetical protein ACEN88_35885, partial [Massilia sp. CT11-108]|uniref:hypothetical protein n=1 Tax=Massilia sp. CT11-108 TaxID=3393900 RepID=UPI0039A6A0A4